MGATLSQPYDGIVTYRSNIRGIVLFTEDLNEVCITINVRGLTPGKHGLHIHECGDLREGCKSACAHYNPTNKAHGDLASTESHAGDLGNIIADDQGLCKMELRTSKFLLADIIGRSLIIHADPDDLGLGGTEESRTTGTSGERVACEIIGLAKRK